MVIWIKNYHKGKDTVEYTKISKKTLKPIKIKGKKYKGVGNQTIIKHIGLLVAALRWGQRYKQILKGVTINQLDRKDISISPVSDNYFQSDEEYKVFQLALLNPKDKFGDFIKTKQPSAITKADKEVVRKCEMVYWLVVFLVHTGARFPSDIQPDRLRVEHIIYEKIKDADGILGTLWLKERKAKKKKVVNSPIPITPRLNEALRFFLGRPVAKNGEDPSLPFMVWDNGTPFNGSNVRRWWNKAMTQAGITRRINIYGARKNAISRWVALGWTITEVQTASGHTDPSILLSVYAKTSHESLARTAQQKEILRNKDYITDSDLTGK